MAAFDAAIGSHADPGKDVAAKALDEGGTFARLSGWDWRRVRAGGQLLQDLRYQREALLHFLDADPDTRVDVARVHDRHLEFELVVRRIAGRAARVERAPRGAAHVAAGGVLPGKRLRQDAGRDGAVLERCGVLVQVHEMRALLLPQREKCGQALGAFGRGLAAHPAGYN